MRARLEGHVQRGATSAVAGGRQCGHFGMRCPPAGVPALADNLTVALDDRADDRMRVVDLPPPALRELERPLEAHASA